MALTGVNVHDSKVFHTTIRVRLDSPGGELLALEIEVNAFGGCPDAPSTSILMSQDLTGAVVWHEGRIG